jgi:hypothetical protein
MILLVFMNASHVPPSSVLYRSGVIVTWNDTRKKRQKPRYTYNGKAVLFHSPTHYPTVDGIGCQVRFLNMLKVSHLPVCKISSYKSASIPAKKQQTRSTHLLAF